jgi:hypothetical protein
MAVHIVDPLRRDKNTSGGWNLPELMLPPHEFELRDRTDTHLRSGQCDQRETLALFEEAVKRLNSELSQSFGLSPTWHGLSKLKWALMICWNILSPLPVPSRGVSLDRKRATSATESGLR